MLFRFSALTYRTARVHYDVEFARQIGYDDVEVQPDLIAWHLLELARSHDARRLGRVEWRSRSPFLVGRRSD
jgi:3-methylfumaryl-CoA hydratase